MAKTGREERTTTMIVFYMKTPLWVEAELLPGCNLIKIHRVIQIEGWMESRDPRVRQMIFEANRAKIEKKVNRLRLDLKGG